MSAIKTYDLGSGLELIEAPDLVSLAAQINTASREAEQHAISATKNALIVGAALIEAKKLVAHGQWNDWVSSNCDISFRVAQSYMRLTKSIPDFDVKDLESPNTKRVSLLPLREAIRAIATDPVAPVKIQGVYLASRTDRERVSSALNKSCNALKKASKSIDFFGVMKGEEITALKKKLTSALDEITRMETESAAQICIDLAIVGGA